VDGWTGVCLKGVGSTLNYQSAACEIKTISTHVQCFSMRDTKRELLHFLIPILVRFISYHTTPHHLSIPSFLTDPY